MQEYIKISIDALSDWMPVEDETERHDRLFRMTDVTCKAFGWPMGGEDFFRIYESFRRIAEKADQYNDHLNLMSLMILKDLMESAELQFATEFHSIDDVHNIMRTAVSTIRVAMEHLLFTENSMKSRSALEALPEEMTKVDFTFLAQHDGDQPLSPDLSGDWNSEDESTVEMLWELSELERIEEDEYTDPTEEDND